MSPQLKVLPNSLPFVPSGYKGKEDKVPREGILEGGKASKALGNSHDIWHLKILD